MRPPSSSIATARWCTTSDYLQPARRSALVHVDGRRHPAAQPRRLSRVRRRRTRAASAWGCLRRAFVRGGASPAWTDAARAPAAPRRRRGSTARTIRSRRVEALRRECDCRKPQARPDPPGAARFGDRSRHGRSWSATSSTDVGLAWQRRRARHPRAHRLRRGCSSRSPGAGARRGVRRRRSDGGHHRGSWRQSGHPREAHAVTFRRFH